MDEIALEDALDEDGESPARGRHRSEAARSGPNTSAAGASESAAASFATLAGDQLAQLGERRLQVLVTCDLRLHPAAVSNISLKAAPAASKSQLDPGRTVRERGTEASNGDGGR